jgi:hypothetical protein
MNYWTNVEEEMCERWRSSGEREQVIIYNKMLPKFEIIYYSLIKLYFNVKGNMDTLKQDTINKALLSLNKFNVKLGKAYTYISVVMKNYLISYFKLLDYRLVYVRSMPIIYNDEEYHEESLIDKLDTLIENSSSIRLTYLKLVKQYYIKHNNINPKELIRYLSKKRNVKYESAKAALRLHLNYNKREISK